MVEQVSDLKRDQYLKSLGIRVLRFSDRDIFTNIEGVGHRILENWGAELG